MPVARLALTDYSSIKNVQRSKQGGGAVARVV
jgi:hypothetical protein